LSITLAASKYVLEVAPEQGSVLFGMLLGGGFKSQTFHYAHAALAKGAGAVDWQTSQFGEWSGGLHGPGEIARIDRRQRFGFESACG